MRSCEELREHEPAELADLRNEVAQLRTALETRIVIEQAKGVLAERYTLTIDDAFLLLRKGARSARMRIHDLAAEVVANPQTPATVVRGMIRDARLRSAALRERNQAAGEVNANLRSAHTTQKDRIQRPKAHFRTTSRSDAVDLAARLNRYRWYLLVPDDEHWEVVVEFTGASHELPHELRARVDEWLSARSLPSVHVKLGDTETTLHAQ
jgi:ANTAR domain